MHCSGSPHLYQALRFFYFIFFFKFPRAGLFLPDQGSSNKGQNFVCMEETCTSSVGVSLSHPLLLGAVLSLLVEVFSICLVTQSSVNLLFTCGWALGERCS